MGVEPTRPYGHLFLKQARLPFRHTAAFRVSCYRLKGKSMSLDNLSTSVAYYQTCIQWLSEYASILILIIGGVEPPAPTKRQVIAWYRDPGGIQTHDLLFRRQSRYSLRHRTVHHVT